MIRRDFMKLVGSSVLAKMAYVDRVEAARQPDNPNNAKVMLFGLAVISADQSGHKAVFPTVGKHASFLVGQERTLAALANGRKLVAAAGSNISEGHEDIGLAGEFLLCYDAPNLSIGSGESTMQPNLTAHLPKLADIADLMSPSQEHTLKMPSGSLEVSLHGGHLRMPGKFSTNKGTHNIPWQFVDKDDKEIAPPVRLADLLVYHSQSNSMDISVNGQRRASLAPGERLWILNFPTYAPKDETPLVIEHAHEWLKLVDPPVPDADKAKIVARTAFTRGSSSGKELRHPCAEGEVAQRLRPEPGQIRFFPPDTDPCFLVMA